MIRVNSIHDLLGNQSGTSDADDDVLDVPHTTTVTVTCDNHPKKTMSSLLTSTGQHALLVLVVAVCQSNLALSTYAIGHSEYKHYNLAALCVYQVGLFLAVQCTVICWKIRTQRQGESLPGALHAITDACSYDAMFDKDLILSVVLQICSTFANIVLFTSVASSTVSVWGSLILLSVVLSKTVFTRVAPTMEQALILSQLLVSCFLWTILDASNKNDVNGVRVNSGDSASSDITPWYVYVVMIVRLATQGPASVLQHRYIARRYHDDDSHGDAVLVQLPISVAQFILQLLVWLTVTPIQQHCAINGWSWVDKGYNAYLWWAILSSVVVKGVVMIAHTRMGSVSVQIGFTSAIVILTVVDAVTGINTPSHATILCTMVIILSIILYLTANKQTNAATTSDTR